MKGLGAFGIALALLAAGSCVQSTPLDEPAADATAEGGPPDSEADTGTDARGDAGSAIVLLGTSKAIVKTSLWIEFDAIPGVERGDLLLVALYVSSGFRTIEAVPSGWTERGTLGSEHCQTRQRASWYWRIAADVEPKMVRFGADIETETAGVMVAYRGIAESPFRDERVVEIYGPQPAHTFGLPAVNAMRGDLLLALSISRDTIGKPWSTTPPATVLADVGAVAAVSDVVVVDGPTTGRTASADGINENCSGAFVTALRPK